MSDDLDYLIDDAARRMTEGAARDDLRARVLARLSTTSASRISNPGRARRLWALAPLAAAALVLVAIVVPRFVDRAAESPAPQTAAVQNPSQSATVPSRRTVAGPSVQNMAHPLRAANPIRRGLQTAAAASEIATLAPAPIETPSIDIDAMITESIAIPPLEAIDPIPVVPLATPEGERP